MSWFPPRGAVNFRVILDSENFWRLTDMVGGGGTEIVQMHKTGPELEYHVAEQRTGYLGTPIFG